ncbi:MAG: SUMF1/EgtB/PvdO family nonheme iron enzyme, partial [Phaeodactylibacter sp.]|nr:SUMF1/EgtB/PvdO family nonheme iron enzyme [Phaeodactylibacter sp.]
ALHTRKALSRMGTFSDSWVTADGRAWRAEPLPPKGKDGFLLSGGKATLPWTQRGTAGQGSEPVPTLVIRNFYLSPQEVTNGDFSQFCIETRRVRPGGINWSQRDHPVANISWYDAVEYCNWLSEKQGLKAVYKIKRDNKDPNNFNRLDSLNWAVTADWWANGYRLPTVTEWEYAFSQRGHLNSYGGFGLYNMGQKVQEWCWNWDYPDAYRIAIKNRDPHGPEAGAFRSLRGGGIDGILHRQPDDGATSETPSRKRNNAGFRLVRNGW